MCIEELTNSQIFVSALWKRYNSAIVRDKWDTSFSIVFYTLCFSFLLFFWVEVVLGVASFCFVLGF